MQISYRLWTRTGISLTITTMIIVFFVAGMIASAREGSTADGLLQKGLTLFEIDQELARITAEETKLNARLTAAGQEIGAAGQAVEETKTHAARVLRAYYMGDRDSLWTLLFSIRSFSEGLASLEYLQMILRSDTQALLTHRQSLDRLTDLRQRLVSDQTALALARTRYTEQRARMIALQHEIDAQLAGAEEREALALQQRMLALNRLWHDQGIPLFRTYFQALASALPHLSDIITDNKGTGSTVNLAFNGLNSTFQITDSELNAFLRKRNELFRNMTFRFEKDRVLASGEQEGVTLSVEGRYELAGKEEGGHNLPYIAFRIQQLQFNGLVLPQSTIDDFAKQFDLGIYPQKIASFLQAKEVTTETGRLTVLFKLAL